MDYPTFISVEEAFNAIDSTVRSFGTEQIPLGQSLGRILGESIYADRDFPPFDRVAMDGIAINTTSFDTNKTFAIEGVAQAGAPQKTLRLKENCIEVMTGCMLPKNTNAVVRYEDIDVQNGIATIHLEKVKPFQNVHKQGLDKKSGVRLASRGQYINSALIAVLATVGKENVRVNKNPKTVIISTGNELVDVNEIPQPYQIRKSNVYAIESMLKSKMVHADIFHLKDDYQQIYNDLNKILQQYELIILSGGVSMGKYDFLPKALNELGVKTLFHKVTERPGKPFWFGSFDQTSTIFALPGNPISTTMCATVYINHWLHKSIGIPSNKIQASLGDDVIFNPDLTYFMEVELATGVDGKNIVKPKKGNGSGDLANLVGIDGFVELPKGPNKYVTGAIYNVYLID